MGGKAKASQKDQRGCMLEIWQRTKDFDTTIVLYLRGGVWSWDGLQSVEMQSDDKAHLIT